LKKFLKFESFRPRAAVRQRMLCIQKAVVLMTGVTVSKCGRRPAFSDLTSFFERLHLRARELISSGVLPRAAPDKLFGGLGSKSACALCGASIIPSEVEYELEYPAVGAASGSSSRRQIRFHLPCHAIWDYERLRP